MMSPFLQLFAVVTVLAACTVAIGVPAACLPGETNHPLCGRFEWGAVGDSWSSGVAYSKGVTYDDNKDECLRLKFAYAAQMEKDHSWTRGVQKPHFVGCSGTRLRDIWLVDGQIKKTGSPSVIVMTSGGNDAGFGKIVDDCIYHAQKLDYGPPWDKDTNETGQCKLSLKELQEYLDNRERGLAYDLKVTIDDVFKSEQAKSHDEFWFYITSYVHFFNDQTDWCDKRTFAPVNAIRKPRLVRGLRQVFNDKVEQFNNIYADVINNYKPPKNMHIGFIPISPGFDHHRFCEPEHQYLVDQFFSKDVWIWNLSYINGGNEVGSSITGFDEDGIEYLGQPEEAITADYAGIASEGSGGNEISNGWKFRVFHPKIDGHTAIKDAIIARFRADKIPGVA